MKFMLIFAGDPEEQARLTEQQHNEGFNNHAAVSAELAAAGKMLCMDRLCPPSEAVTIRQHNGTPTLTDGPFAETSEVIGGYVLIEAESREEAVAWAKRYEEHNKRTVEVRPVRTGAVWRRPTKGAERYMLLFVSSDDTMLAKSVSEFYDIIDHHYEVSLDLAAEGKFVASRALEDPKRAVTVRFDNGECMTVDGPFAEAKEYLGGFFVIACDSREEAVEWGTKLLRGLDAVEVRPVRYE